jgi:hypothetical protein
VRHHAGTCTDPYCPLHGDAYVGDPDRIEREATAMRYLVDVCGTICYGLCGKRRERCPAPLTPATEPPASEMTQSESRHGDTTETIDGSVDNGANMQVRGVP